MKILLFGSSGQLGKEIKNQIKLNNHFILKSYNRRKVDITNKSLLDKIFKKQTPNVVILAAAYTKVDDAERNKLLCKKINLFSTKYIVKLCKKYNSLLIFYSTDYVFNGKKRTPYNEDDMPKPINYYGKTKYFAENCIQKSKINYIIIRTSRLFGKFSKNNFFYKFKKILNEKNSVNVVNDQFGNLISVKTLAKFSIKLLIKSIREIEKGNEFKEIFNIVSEGKLSFYQNAKIILKYLTKENQIKYSNKKIYPIKSKLLNLNANRPKYSSLSVKKIQNYLNIRLPNYKMEIKNYYNEI
tara:strand:+ start:92 stop:985 length:894 start_codon:yes stop_codon:yes gene_type:complete